MDTTKVRRTKEGLIEVYVNNGIRKVRLVTTKVDVFMEDSNGTTLIKVYGDWWSTDIPYVEFLAGIAPESEWHEL